MVRASSAAAPRRTRARRSVTLASTCATSTRRPTGRSRARRRRTTRPMRTCISPDATSCCSRKRRVCARVADRSHRDRPLARNPFPDATPDSRGDGRALSLGLDHALQSRRRIVRLTRRTSSGAAGARRAVRAHPVVHEPGGCHPTAPSPRGGDPGCHPPAPSPRGGDPACHPPAPSPRGGDPGRGDASTCGRCSKCRERRDAFAAAGIADPAGYAHASPR